MVTIAERIRASPEESFPKIVETEAELTALYRFLNNDGVSARLILEPHQRQTALRCAEVGGVVVIHDTTEIEFTGVARRRGLGHIRSKNDQGLLLHAALAVGNDGSRRPLGILGAQTWVRPTLGTSRHPDGRKKSGGAYFDEVNKESSRWWKLIDDTEQQLGGVDAVHVFDREGDAYALLRTVLDQEARFVTRMARDRVVLDEDDERIGRVSEALVDVVDEFQLEVTLSPRAAKANAPLNRVSTTDSRGSARCWSNHDVPRTAPLR